jgi:hypothetical protein
MDIRSIRIKNKLSFDSLRSQFVPSFRPKSSSSSSQHSHFSQSNYSPSSASSYGRSRQSTEADTDTLFEIDEAELEMSFSRSIAAKHFKSFMGSSHAEKSHRNDNHIDAKNNRIIATDSISIYSDAAGEPLVDDGASDYIPKSARPLVYGDNSQPQQKQHHHQEATSASPPQVPRSRSASPPRPISRSRADLEHYQPVRTPEPSRHRTDSVQSKLE